MQGVAQPAAYNAAMKAGTGTVLMLAKCLGKALPPQASRPPPCSCNLY